MPIPLGSKYLFITPPPPSFQCKWSVPKSRWDICKSSPQTSCGTVAIYCPVGDILPDCRYNVHNAGDDVRMLYDLLSVAGVTEEQLQEHSFLMCR
jgi:hypothetical protein